MMVKIYLILFCLVVIASPAWTGEKANRGWTQEQAEKSDLYQLCMNYGGVKKMITEGHPQQEYVENDHKQYCKCWAREVDKYFTGMKKDNPKYDSERVKRVFMQSYVRPKKTKKYQATDEPQDWESFGNKYPAESEEEDKIFNECIKKVDDKYQRSGGDVTRAQ
jgi:hypothetical protein